VWKRVEGDALGVTRGVALQTREKPLASLNDESARLAVHRVGAATRAELLHLQAVGVVPTVLLGDVVAFLAVDARNRDLRTNVRALAGHGNPSPQLCTDWCVASF